MVALKIAAAFFFILLTNFCLCEEPFFIKFNQKISSGKNGKILTILIKAEDLQGRIRIFNETRDILFGINKILNVSGGFGRDLISENINQPKAVNDANIGKNAISVEEISEELNEELLLKISFLPQIWNPHIKLLPETNEKLNNEEIKKKPWELHLVIVPSVYCDYRFFGYYEKCQANFFLKTYSLHTQFRVIENDKTNGKIIKKEWKPDFYNLKWSLQIKHAFKCLHEFLSFNALSDTFITFTNLKMAIVISDVGAETKAKFPAYSLAYEDCEPSNNSSWTSWIQDNLCTMFLVFSLFVVLFVLFLRYLKIRQEQLITSGNYNFASSPFYGFGDVDTVPFYSNDIAKKSSQGFL